LESRDFLKSALIKFTERSSILHHASLVLEKLHFREIRRRWDRIPDASSVTNQWLFDDHESSRHTGFRSWLKADSGMYWITGKVGLGFAVEKLFLLSAV